MSFLLDLLMAMKAQWPALLVYTIFMVGLCLWDGRTIRNLRNELELTKMELDLVKTAKKADESAILTYDKKREDAESTAKGRHHALDGISPDDSESTIVLHCINGLCVRDEQRVSYPPSGSAPDSMREAEKAGGAP